MRKDIYYAHHLYKYDTKIEQYELDLIKKILPDCGIVNPNGDVAHKDFFNEEKIMEECLSTISSDDIIGVVFSSINGVVGKGVFDEVNHALKLGKAVYYINNNTLQKRSHVDFDVINESKRFYAIVRC